jgi:uncharacterized NAD(P)/FAD-binding protein YdhS
MGTSLSGLDAAMAVVMQHGEFRDDKFVLDKGSDALKIVLMSRTGILPEADFYCPIPYEPLSVLTEFVVESEIAKGSDGLLDRIFALMVKELQLADPAWCEKISLHKQNADSIREAWFEDRKRHGPFTWAEENLNEVERNKRERRTVAWRYTVLRLHEVVQEIVPHLNERDRERFKQGLARVFIDNYAAIPPQSIRRLLALREAGIISVATLGDDYALDVGSDRTVITTQETVYRFDVFIDARGQKPLKTKDLPFPTLRKQLEATGEEIPDVGEDYTLNAPDAVRGRIAFGAIPWLMHDRPFVQGLAECAEIAEAMAKAAEKPASGSRADYRISRTDRASMPCCRGLLEEDFRVFRQRNEGFRRFIQGKNFAAFNVVHPAVQSDGVITQAHRDGRVGLNVAQLRKHVLLHHRIHFIDRLIPGFLLYHGFRRVGIAQPV